MILIWIFLIKKLTINIIVKMNSMKVKIKTKIKIKNKFLFRVKNNLEKFQKKNGLMMIWKI
jgi:hypothetical protein